ncbi:hypothetical protein ACLQ24_10565 [Micromonospora sp. DT4]|uniref:hypothetical protein n=1 Tax=Micromonospora sp. DT4 TaxID=3393438 RepID=UPI003CF4AB53
MKINSQVEPLARNAIHAAVQQDLAKLRAALRAIPNDRAAHEAVALALAVTLLVMTDIHHGKPSDEQTRAVAAEIVRAEAWAQAGEEQVFNFLLRLVNGEPLAQTIAEEHILLAFVAAANLLSSCRRDSEEWWDHLDRAEAALET